MRLNRNVTCRHIQMALRYVVVTCLVLACGQRLLAADSAGPATIVAALTAEQRDWLASQREIVINMDDGNPPMNFRDDDGELKGITVDYLRAIEARIGVPIVCRGSSWSEALAGAMAHTSDGIANAFDKPERRLRLDFTEPYFVSPMALVIPQGARAPERLEDYDGKRIAVVARSTRVALLRDHCPRATLVETRDLGEAMSVLSAGEADALLDDQVVVSYTLTTEFHANLKVGLLYYHAGDNEGRFGLTNAKPHLRAIFDAAIADMEPVEHREISQRWLRKAESVTVQRSLDLSEAEREFLVAHPVIRVAADPDWPPFEYIDTSGVAHGLAIDYLAEVERALGIDFQITVGKTWAELVEMAKAREVDMFSCVARTAEREAYLAFTEPYASQPVVIFGRRELGWIGDLDALVNKRVAVVEGYAAHDWLIARHPGIDVVPCTDINQAFSMVRTGQADAFVDNGLVGARRLNKLGMSDIAVIGETPYAYTQAFAVRDDWPLLRSILDKALKAVGEERRREIRNQWLPATTAVAPSMAWVWWSLGGVVAAALMILAWNWHLSAMVRVRTRALSEANRKLEEQIISREEAEGRLVQAQKMDAIGQLAGGIAHDFNNMLGGIFGACDLMVHRLGGQDEKTAHLLGIIQQSAQNAAELTGKLLAFGRKGKTVTRPMEVHACLTQAVAILERTIDRRIRVVCDFKAERHVIVGDGTLILNAFLNLAINARDAMPDGGELRISTRNEALDLCPDPRSSAQLGPGAYLRIDVRDTGHGMPPEIVDRIFEPFFTTKEQGKGTGLGLAAVYGTIRDHHGGVAVTSNEQGSCFTVHLPVADEVVVVEEESPGGVPAGSGRILVVDDEPLVRSTVAMLLENLGYTVVQAEDGVQGLERYRAEGDAIDLVVLDMVMPNMSGQDCARAILAHDPTARIIMASGFAEQDAMSVFSERGGLGFLKKPFNRSSLAKAVHDILQQS